MRSRAFKAFIVILAIEAVLATTSWAVGVFVSVAAAILTAILAPKVKPLARLAIGYAEREILWWAALAAKMAVHVLLPDHLKLLSTALTLILFVLSNAM